MKDFKSIYALYTNEFTAEYRKLAVAYQKQHNKVCPDDRWILHGTYERTIVIYNAETETLEPITVHVIRFRSKRTGRTFSFQGGFLLKRIGIAGLALLELLARDKRQNYSFERTCIEQGYDLNEVMRADMRLRNFMAANGTTIEAAKGSDDSYAFLDLFLDQYWFVTGNPFCSEMEAGML